LGLPLNLKIHLPPAALSGLNGGLWSQEEMRGLEICMDSNSIER
jgi:hypothetical protein